MCHRNVYDYPRCTAPFLCEAAPLLSVISGPGLLDPKGPGHLDLMVPPFLPTYAAHRFPWEEKSDIAFFR